MSPAVEVTPEPRLVPVAPWLSLSLVAAVGAVLWSDAFGLGLPGSEPIVIRGVAAALGLHLLLLVGRRNRTVAQRRVQRLDRVRDRQRLVPDEPHEAPVVAEAVAPLRAVAPWCASLGMIGVMLALRFDVAGPPWAGAWPDGWTASIVGAVVSLLVACIAIVAVRDARAARRCGIAIEAAGHSEALALDTVHAMPVLISFAGTDGKRVRFNRRFTELTGRTERELAGSGWLELVDVDDRATYREHFRNASSRPVEPIWIEYGLTAGNGDHRWFQEHIAPRFESGRHVGYVATAIDVTSEIRAAGEHTSTVERLAEEAEAARADDAARIASLEEQLAEAGRARDRFHRAVESAQEKALKAGEQLTLARTEAKQAVADVQAARIERTEMEAANRTLVQSVERLERLVERMEAEERMIREQQERTEAKLAEARAEADAARGGAEDLRAELKGQRERADTLEAALDEARIERARAEADLAEHTEASERQTLRSNRDLAQMIAAPLRASGRLAHGLDGAALKEGERRDLDAMRATLAALNDLVAPAPIDPLASPRSCDLRPVVRAVAEVLTPVAEPRGAELRCVVHPDFPPNVVADPALLGSIAMHLVAATFDAVEGGRITLALSDDGATPTHVTARLEVRHDTARLDEATLRARFALDTDEAAGPLARVGAAAAWRDALALGADYGVDALPDGGFAAWISVTLARPAFAPEAAVVEPRPTASQKPDVIPLAQTDEALEPAPRMPRMPQEFHECNLGAILELGGDEVKVKCTKVPEDLVTIELRDDDDVLELEAEPESSERLGMRSHAVVFHFVDVTPAQRRWITRLAMAHRKRSMLPINSIASDDE